MLIIYRVCSCNHEYKACCNAVAIKLFEMKSNPDLVGKLELI